MEIVPENTEPEPEMTARLARLASGSVLLALDTLKDPNFDSTVVLICAFSKVEGAYGLVLNRPSHMPLSEVFDGFGDLDISRKLYIGGPVNQGALQIIQVTDQPQKESHCLAPRVYLGGQWDALESIMTDERENLRLFLGYSGWAPGQLEDEILAGAWDVYNLPVERLLAAGDDRLATGLGDLKAYLESIL